MIQNNNKKEINIMQEISKLINLSVDFSKKIILDVKQNLENQQRKVEIEKLNIDELVENTLKYGEPFNEKTLSLIYNKYFSRNKQTDKSDKLTSIYGIIAYFCDSCKHIDTLKCGIPTTHVRTTEEIDNNIQIKYDICCNDIYEVSCYNTIYSNDAIDFCFRCPIDKKTVFNFDNNSFKDWECNKYKVNDFFESNDTGRECTEKRFSEYSIVCEKCNDRVNKLNNLYLLFLPCNSSKMEERKSINNIKYIAKYSEYLRKKDIERNNEFMVRQEKYREERNAIIKNSDVIYMMISDIINNYNTITIDSNIWMNIGYDAFFITLRDIIISNKKQLNLYGPQFDEICNIKKKTQYGEIQNKLARCAISRIDEFQNNDLLNIEPMTLDAERGVYADPLIIELIIKLLHNGEKVCFITDDIELKIRVKALAKSFKDNLKVMSGKDIIYLCKNYCQAKNFSYVNDNIDSFGDNNDQNKDS